ncbi:MAG TPA: PrsW family glutamic-type intramembrane protease [Egibacteraceae bacterium]|nr:PrsW family glutamic-type intramembrane protease [Egibacteraceae bacterium]
MNDPSPGQVFAFALTGSLLPALGWLWFFYTRDRYDREPKRLIAKLFLIGALPVGILAGLINVAVVGLFGVVVTAVLVAPIGEETLKYLGARRGAGRHPAFDEPVDGMVYGASVGLGFAAAESVDYLTVAYAGGELWGEPVGCAGLACFAVVAVLRGLGSALLHALCSAIAGYFLARRILEAAPAGAAVGGVSLAALFHGLWNGTGLLLGFVTLGAAAVVFTRLLRRALARSPHHGRQLLPHAPETWFPAVPPPPPPGPLR